MLINYKCRSVGHHSTSDDSFAYRARQEVEDRKRIDNPLARLRLFLESRKWWDAQEEEALKAKQKRSVMDALKKAEATPRWGLKELFSDVYGGEEPWNIVSSDDLAIEILNYYITSPQTEQKAELKALLHKYGEDWAPWKNELEKVRGKGADL
jgi:2-oxoisovalerate dehydrogenase E1 component alpha subunit